MDLNLNTLKPEILEYLEANGLTVFYGRPGGLEETHMVLWDVENHPDYRKFLDTARAAGAQIIVFAAREFEVSDLDDLTGHLDDLTLDREERRDYESRLRDLRGYDGTTCSIELAFSHDSRFYVFELQPDWYEEFLNLEEELLTNFDGEEGLGSDDDSLGGFYSKN